MTIVVVLLDKEVAVEVEKVQKANVARMRKVGSAYGIRTRVTAVRGRRPGPLDECARSGWVGETSDSTANRSRLLQRILSAMRILLPVRPDNDCSVQARIIEALFGHEDISLLRIFVYRPAELDAYDPQMLAVVPGIRRLDETQLQEVVSATKAHCRGLVEHGFHIESAIVRGFPVDKIIDEAKSWKADLILLHVTQEKLHECRIGR